MYSTRRLVILGCARRDGRAESRGALYPTVGYGFVSLAVIGGNFFACGFFADGRPDTIGCGRPKQFRVIEKAASNSAIRPVAGWFGPGGFLVRQRFFLIRARASQCRNHDNDAKTEYSSTVSALRRAFRSHFAVRERLPPSGCGVWATLLRCVNCSERRIRSGRNGCAGYHCGQKRDQSGFGRTGIIHSTSWR